MTKTVLSWWKGQGTGWDLGGSRMNFLFHPPTPQYHVIRHSFPTCWVERTPRPPSRKGKGVPWVLGNSQELVSSLAP